MMESSATEDENIVKPDKKPKYSIKSNAIATESPAASSVSFLE